MGPGQNQALPGASMAVEAPELGSLHGCGGSGTWFPGTLQGAPSLSPAHTTGTLQAGWPQAPVCGGEVLRLADLRGLGLGSREPDRLGTRCHPCLSSLPQGCHISQNESLSPPTTSRNTCGGHPRPVSGECLSSAQKATLAWDLPGQQPSLRSTRRRPGPRLTGGCLQEEGRQGPGQEGGREPQGPPCTAPECRLRKALPASSSARWPVGTDEDAAAT